jgi:hypothetical protein
VIAAALLSATKMTTGYRHCERRKLSSRLFYTKRDMVESLKIPLQSIARLPALACLHRHLGIVALTVSCSVKGLSWNEPYRSLH